MRLRRLILREIVHRRGSFALGVVSVTVAVAALVSAILSLAGHDLRSEEILAAMQAETERLLDAKERATRERMAALEDDYRKITKKMGYNVLVLPVDVNLADFHADDYASKYMPEDYADRLASSRIVTVNHLLPNLKQKIHWPEAKRTIILMGTKGQVPIAHVDPMKPIQEAVPRGQIVLGHELHTRLGLAAGDETTLLGRKFAVAATYAARGTKDDISAWIHLSDAQELLDKRGLINGILALECNCPGDPSQRLELIRNEIRSILPDTQVTIFQSQALARVEARRRAEETAHQVVAAERAASDELLAGERSRRLELRAEQASFAAAIGPLVVLVASIWIGFLALSNARERESEIGILRALGLRTRAILGVFLSRALIIGVIGAIAGYATGLAGGALWSGLSPGDGARLFDPALLVTVLFAAPILSVLATWIPAYASAQRDPALALRKEA